MTDHELDKRTSENIFIENNIYPLCTVKIRSSPVDLGFLSLRSSNVFFFPIAAKRPKYLILFHIWGKGSTCELRNVAWHVVFWSVLTVLHVLQSADGLLDFYCLLLLFVGFEVNVTFFSVRLFMQVSSLMTRVLKIKQWLVFGITLEMMFKYSVIAISA